jgi:hypothetical protein
MLTVAQLIEFLAMYPPGARIINHEAQEYNHISSIDSDTVVLSTVQPIAHCKRTGEYVYPTEVDEYYGVCPATDENLYQFETVPLLNEH